MQMPTVIAATKARNNFFDILDSVKYKGEEFVVEKNGEPVAMVSPMPAKRSPEEIDRIIADVRKVFAKSKRRKYWSVLGTPEWKRREKAYFKSLYKRVNKYRKTGSK